MLPERKSLLAPTAGNHRSIYGDVHVDSRSQHSSSSKKTSWRIQEARSLFALMREEYENSKQLSIPKRYGELKRIINMFTAEPVTQKLLYLTTQESERGQSRAVLFGPRMSYNSSANSVHSEQMFRDSNPNKISTSRSISSGNLLSGGSNSSLKSSRVSQTACEEMHSENTAEFEYDDRDTESTTSTHSLSHVWSKTCKFFVEKVSKRSGRFERGSYKNTNETNTASVQPSRAMSTMPSLESLFTRSGRDYRSAQTSHQVSNSSKPGLIRLRSSSCSVSSLTLKKKDPPRKVSLPQQFVLNTAQGALGFSSPGSVVWESQWESPMPAACKPVRTESDQGSRLVTRSPTGRILRSKCFRLEAKSQKFSRSSEQVTPLTSNGPKRFAVGSQENQQRLDRVSAADLTPKIGKPQNGEGYKPARRCGGMFTLGRVMFSEDQFFEGRPDASPVVQGRALLSETSDTDIDNLVLTLAYDHIIHLKKQYILLDGTNVWTRYVRMKAIIKSCMNVLKSD